jgi:hypothetical protein
MRLQPYPGSGFLRLTLSVFSFLLSVQHKFYLRNIFTGNSISEGCHASLNNEEKTPYERSNFIKQSGNFDFPGKQFLPQSLASLLLNSQPGPEINLVTMLKYNLCL